MYRTTATELTFTLHVVQRSHVVERDDGSDEDEHPSLPSTPVVETTGEDITHVTRPRPLAKCGPVAPDRKRVAR